MKIKFRLNEELKPEEVSSRLNLKLIGILPEDYSINSSELITLHIKGEFHKEKVVFYLYERILKISTEIIEFPLLEECQETMFFKNTLVHELNKFCIKTLSNKLREGKILYKAFFNVEKVNFVQKFVKKKRTSHLLKTLQNILGKEEFSRLFNQSDLIGEKGSLLIDNCWHFIKDNPFLLERLNNEESFYSILFYKIDYAKLDNIDTMKELFSKRKFSKQKAKKGFVKKNYCLKFKDFFELETSDVIGIILNYIKKFKSKNNEKKFLQKLSFENLKLIFNEYDFNIDVLFEVMKSREEHEKKEFLLILLDKLSPSFNKYGSFNRLNTLFFMNRLSILSLNSSLKEKIPVSKFFEIMFPSRISGRSPCLIHKEDFNFVLENSKEFYYYFKNEGISKLRKLNQKDLCFLINNKIIDLDFITSGKNIDLSYSLGYSPIYKLNSFEELFLICSIKNNHLKREIINHSWDNHHSIIRIDKINKIIALKMELPEEDEQLFIPILKNEEKIYEKISLNYEFFNQLCSLVKVLKIMKINARRIVKFLMNNELLTDTVYMASVIISHLGKENNEAEIQIKKFVEKSLDELCTKKIKSINILHDEFSMLLRKIEQKDFSLKQTDLKALHDKKFIHKEKEYTFFVPESNHNLIEIGKLMNICVGNGYYGRRILENNIFIICLKNDKNEYYACIEIDKRTRKVVQSKCPYNQECKVIPVGTKFNEFLEKLELP